MDQNHQTLKFCLILYGIGTIERHVNISRSHKSSVRNSLSLIFIQILIPFQYNLKSILNVYSMHKCKVISCMCHSRIAITIISVNGFR